MRYFLCILFVLNCNALFTQSLFINAYSTKEGLSNKLVYCIKQDSRGFLWAGTQEGLSRFDGYSFKNFFAEKNSANGIPNDNILDVVEYQYGKLLLATGSGIGVLNTLTGAFENEKIKMPFLKTGSGTRISSMYKDQQANIWVNHSGELDVLDSNLNYLYRFTDLNWAKNLKGIFIICEQWYTDKRGRLWLPSDSSGLHIIDFAAKKVFNSQNNPEHLPFLKKCAIRSFCLDEENNKLLYSPWGEGLRCYDFITGTEQQELFNIPYFKGEDRTINSMIKMSRDIFLIYLGADCYEVNTVHFNTRLIPEKKMARKNGDRGTAVITLLKAGSQQYWAGTLDGLFICGMQQPSYTELSLSNNGVNREMECTDMILSKSGRLYCTYTDQLIIIEKNRKDIGSYPFHHKNKCILTEVCEDQSGNIWIGTTKGIYLFDTAGKKMIQPPEIPSELLNISISTLYCDRDGDIWIGSRGSFGLYRYNVAGNQVQKINNDVTTHFEKVGDRTRISNISEDNEGHLWMTSRIGGGIICYAKKKDEWKRYPNSNSHFKFLANKGITCLYADDKGFLWLSNQFGDGLIRFDYQNDSVLQFSRNDGLQSSAVKNICSDRSGNIWLVSEYGITSFNTKNAKHELTISYDGFINDEQHMIFDSFTNMLVVTALNKLVMVPTAINSTQYNIPPPVIDRITINNEPFFFNSTKQPSFNHNQKNIAIEFTAANFRQNEKILFAYKMKGVDDDWKYADKNRLAQYSILAPGTYTFLLKTGNESGNWNSAIETFTFSITPPWWKTWWFISTLAVSIFFLTYLLIKWRETTIKAIAAEKLKVQQLNAEQYKSKLELERIINYFSSSLNDKTKVEEVLWDTAKNLIGRIGFVDCMIYLWNDDKTKMIQKAGFGPKGSIEEITKQHFDVLPGQGVVGYVMQTKEPLIIPDTSQDSRYRPDEMIRLSEITVPVIYNNELIGIIDSEHHEKNFFTNQHLQIMNTIATMMANKIKSIEAEESVLKTNTEMNAMSEQLSKARLEALRSQMNPHFIFNCINSIDALIHSNDKYNATVYLNKFAKLLRNILDASRQDTVPFSRDIETLKLYIELEELRNENKFKTQLNIETELIEGDYKIPPLIVQPFVENAIQHGLKNRPGNEGILAVEITRKNDTIQYRISDNGIGRVAASRIIQNKESHLGMQMSYDRVKLFNNEETASVVINDLYEDKIASGTTVIVHLNII